MPTAKGPAKLLRRNPTNPRYFQDASGQAVLITGFHTWTNLIDMDRGEPKPFDYDWYLRTLDDLGHNFIRLWAWDTICTWDARDRARQFPWARTGPGEAVDGLPKFDLGQFDESYFDRLEARVSAANDLGIYVGVMLFESWCTFRGNTAPLDWHVFASGNNVNGVDILAHEDDGWLVGWMGLADPAVTAYQEAYIEKVVHRLNKYPNVLYEVSNEAGSLSYAWQEHVMAFVRKVESVLPVQHLIAITGGMGTRDEAFYRCSGDYIAAEGWVPEGEPAAYRDGGATWGGLMETGLVPIILDTDHLWGIGGHSRWAWQSFLRGYHCLYMDRISDTPFAIFEHPWWPDPSNTGLRRELGVIRRLALTMDLNTALPANHRSSSGWALEFSGGLAAMTLEGQAVHLDLEPGNYKALWREVEGETWESGGVEVSTGGLDWTPPTRRDTVIVLRR